MKYKLSGLGIISVVAYVIFNLSNGYLQKMDQATYGYEASPFMDNLMFWSMGVGLLAIIPSIEFMIKAYKKHYLKEEYRISTLSIILTVLSFGMPFFGYAFTSMGAKILFGSHEDYDQEIWGFIILSILTLGFIWLGFLIAIGPALFMYRRIVEGVFTTEETSGVEVVSLIIATLVTLGIMWIIIGFAVVYSKLFFQIAVNKTETAYVEYSNSLKVWAIVLGVITLGTVPLAAFTSYFTYELFLNNIDSTDIKRIRTKEAY